MKRSNNPGKRERQAGKRHRRALVWSSLMGSDVAPLKVGRSHSGRWMRKLLTVADSRKVKLAKGIEESDRQYQPE
jgi:hypothetical protein